MDILVDFFNQNETYFGFGYRRDFDEQTDQTLYHNFTIGLILLSIHISIKKRSS